MHEFARNKQVSFCTSYYLLLFKIPEGISDEKAGEFFFYFFFVFSCDKNFFSSSYSDSKKFLEFVFTIANCFRRADFVTPSTHFEEVVESESASSFKTDLDVDCTFEEYMCSNSQL